MVLSLAGIVILILSLAIFHNNGFAALGIATLLIGITAASLPRRIEASDAFQILTEDAALSTDRILESVLPSLTNSKLGGLTQIETSDVKNGDKELSLLEQTVFLPPKDGFVSAFVPIGNSKHAPDEMGSAPFAAALSGSQSIQSLAGVRVYPVGASVPNIPALKNDGDGTSSLISIQDALEFVLIESSGVCSTLNSSELGENIIVEMDGIKIKTTYPSYLKYLGSIPSSLVASVIATIRNKPVSIVDETDTLDRKLVRLKLWS
jgi:hypothetical protein